MKTLFGGAVVAVLCTLSTLARADGDLEALLEEPVVSTASRTAETASDAPATSSTLTAEDLRRYGIRSLDEAINFLSLGMITQNPLHSVDVSARGVGITADFGNHVLVLVDGHAVNEQWDGTAYFERGLAIPLELIDHVEVILGPGSVLYGSNAMLGVIHVVTKRAKDFDGVHLVVESDIPTAIRGAAGVGKEFRLFGAPAEATFMAEYYAQNGPAFGFPNENYGADGVTGAPKAFSPNGPPTGIWGGKAANSYWTRIPSAYGRIRVGDFDLGVRAATYKRATPYTSFFNQFYGDFDDPDSYELDRWVSLDLKHRAIVSKVVSIASRLYADAYDYQQSITTSAAEDCIDGAPNGCRTHLLGRSRWAGLEVQPSADWLGDGRFVTLVGADGRYRNYGSSFDSTDRITNVPAPSTNVYSHTEGALGVYAQQTAHPWEPLGLNAGARYDYDQRFGSKLSPRAAISVSPWDKATLKAIYAEAFRSPTAYETYEASPSGQVPAFHLRPETVRSVEGSFEQRFGANRVLVGVFRSWWYDIVTTEALSDAEVAAAVASGQLSSGTTSAVQYRNAGTIDDYGWNAALEGAALDRRLRYGLNVTGAIARRHLADGTEQPLTVAPHAFGNARLSYDLANGFPVLAVAGVVASRRPADRAFDGGFTPQPFAPTELDVKVAATGPFPGVKGLSYRLIGTFAVADHVPYVAGPVQAANGVQNEAVLAPVDRARATIGLQYDLPL